MTHSIRELVGRVRSFFRKREMDEDFDEEMSAHLELSIQNGLERGMTAEEARRAALIDIGGIAQARDLHRESRGLPLLDTMLQDLRYSARTLRRDAGMATFAVLIVGLGVAASSTVFSIFDALLLRPLPFTEPDRLVWIANGESANLSAQTVQAANLLDLIAQNQSFSGVAAYSPFYGAGDIRLTGTSEPERLTAVPVTEEFFPLLGVQPQSGRLFTSEECKWQASRVVLLSHRFWKRRFASEPAVVGRVITLDDAPVMIVGVLPESFDFASIFAPGSRIDLFLPFPLSPETNRQGNTLALIGRLKPTATMRSAQADATLIGERIRSAHPGRERNTFRPKINTLREHVSGRFRTALFVLGCAVGLVMLIVCANLSNLLLARAASRQKEMAIRAALGAGRRRLIVQTLTESVLLSCCGALLGLGLAIGGTRLLAHIQGTSIPLLEQVHVDATALGFTLLMAVLTGIVFGLAPALQVSALELHRALKENGRGSTEGKDHSWMRGSLVVCEIAFACVLLSGAGLLMRSLMRVLDVDLGFHPESTFALRIDPGKEYSSLASRNKYFNEVLRHTRSIAGVEAAGLTDALPLGSNFGWRNWSIAAKGQVYPQGRRPPAFVRIAGDGYLSAMRIALRRGRDITPADTASSEPVIMVNETLARLLWPGEDPIGRIIFTGGGNQERRVVGVVQDVRHLALEQESGSEMYLPIRQTNDYSSVDLVVRGTQSADILTPAVRAELRRMDPNFPASESHTLRELVNQSVFPRRFVVLLLAGFAGFGLLLASLGIYAVISYAVSRRRQEIGIRMALGASAEAVQLRILMQTLKLAAVGMAVGVAASWVAGRAFQGLLFGVTFSDPLTYGTMLVLFAGVAALAGYFPARRASRLNPLDALRAG